MRRLLVVLGVLVVAVVAWFAFVRDALVPDGAGVATSAVEESADATAAKERGRKHAAPGPRPESVSDFFAAWPELGQDRPQDPTLAAVTGRVLAGVNRPVKEAVVEAMQDGALSSRARTRGDGTFLLRNVPPGRGTAVTARAADFAPGGFERLLLVPGQTLDVGVLYLGGAYDPTATNRTEVTVVRAEGRSPVPGAQVTATSTLAGALVALGKWEKQPGGTIVRLATDEKGLAVFEKLPPNFYDFFVEANGLTFVARQRVLVQKDTVASFALELSPAQTIEGKVLDEQGQPVADARVGALRLNNFTMFPVTTSDASGAFTLGGLTGGAYWVFAVKEGLGQKDVQNVEAGRRDLNIVLPQGGAIALKVLDAATAKPVHEFGVRPFKNQPYAYLFSPRVDVKSEDGTWRQQLDKGSWGVEVSAAGYALASLSSVPLDAKDPIEVKLQPAGVLHGRVVAKPGSEPIRGARVFVRRGGFPPSAVKDLQTASDDKGEFVLDHLPLVATKVTISHVDHTEQTFDAEPVARAADGATPPAVEFALGSGGRVVGHAYGPGRVPLAGQQVTLSKGFDPFTMRQVQIASDGAYELKNVPPDRYTVSTGGPRGQRRDVDVVEGGVVTVDFGAETGGQRVTGRLVRGEDPVSGVNVTLEGSDSSVRATSDAQGRVTFENVQPGTYRLHPSSIASSASAEVVVKADEAPAEVTLQMPVLGSIEIHVVDDSTGKPLNGAFLSFEQVADASGQTPTEIRAGGGGRPTADDGIAVFSNLEAGRYAIRCWRDPYGAEMLEGVALGAGETKTGVEIRMAGAGSLTGTVRDSAGKPIEGANVNVLDPKGRRVFLLSFANTSADGTFVQGQVKPGEYDVRIERDGYAPATKRMSVVLGKEARAEFTLLTGGSIEVTALKADDTPAANADVTLFDAQGRRVEKGLTLQNVFSNASNRTNASGKITLKALAAGHYSVKVTSGTTASGTADVTEGTETRVEVRLPQ
jgi:protocatechuate 3,4-dioxygenase beta subunit/uncharacterized protein (DUF2141 family)